MLFSNKGSLYTVHRSGRNVKCKKQVNLLMIDHCHYTGLYRGSAHNISNLKYQIPDADLFIKELRRRFNNCDTRITAENKEKHISFNVKINVRLGGMGDKDGKEENRNIKLRFIDGFRFMAYLDKLSSNLCGTSAIQCDKCKSNMKFINISGD